MIPPRFPPLFSSAARPDADFSSTGRGKEVLRKALGVAARRSIAKAFAGVLLSVLAGAFVLGQIAGPVPPPMGARGPVPLSHLYWNFLRSVVRYDRMADQREQRGGQAGHLRDFQQQQLGFSDEEFAPVRATAQRLEAEIRDLDAQAKAFMAARHAESPLQPDTQAQLHDLQADRQAAFAKEVADLRRQLGPSAADRLDVYIQTHVRPTVLTHLPQPAPAADHDWQKELLSKYGPFLTRVYAQDVAADDLERRGRDGSQIRKLQQNDLGFNDDEFALIRQAAQRWGELSDESFTQRHAIVSSDPAGGVPPELQALRQKREDAIQNEVSNLQKTLSPDLSARLDAYIRSRQQMAP